MEPTLVVTVHGIRTFGQWQDRLSSLLSRSQLDFQIENYTYGYFSVLAFLIPPLRWLSVRSFKSQLESILRRHPGRKITLVGHSFGTHLIGWGLYNLSKDKNFPCVENVILAGSVLRSSFPWGTLIEAGRVKRIINDCGINDSVLVLSQFCVLFTGMAGRIGFTGMTGKQMINRFHKGGHSLYFEFDGRADDGFMKDFWLPLFLQNTVVPNDARKAKGPLQGIYITLLQNADVIKVLAYALIGWALIDFGYLRPRELAEINAARADREAGERMEQVAIASFSAGTGIPAAVSAFHHAELLEKMQSAEKLSIFSYCFCKMMAIHFFSTGTARIFSCGMELNKFFRADK
jgi:hypothetical protein